VVKLAQLSKVFVKYKVTDMISYSELRRTKNQISFGWVETSFLPKNEALILSASENGKVFLATISSYVNYFTSLVGSSPYDFLRDSESDDSLMVIEGKLDNGELNVVDFKIEKEFLRKMAKLLFFHESFSWKGTQFSKIEEVIE
jgi:hypothetical protein